MNMKDSTRLLLFFVFSLFFTHSHATSILQLHIDDMLQQSQFIFEGEVVSSEAKMNSDATFITTYVQFRVTDVIKGDDSKEILNLSFSGGKVGKQEVSVAGMAYPKLGDKGIFFVEQMQRPQVNPLLGWSQGYLRIAKDVSGKERMMTESKQIVLGLEQYQSPDARRSAIQAHDGLSEEGIAQGLKLGQDNEPMSNAMDKDSFKDSLKERLQLLPKGDSE